MSRKNVVFAVLGAFFLTNAILAEMVGGKIVAVGPADWGWKATVGVFLWPVVFVTTDLVNEYFGRHGVRRLTFLTVAMIGWVFVALRLTMQPQADPIGVDGESFNRVFGQGSWIIVGSVVAFLISQLVDVFVFRVLRRRTGKAMLWMRATGSTVVSQVIDSVVVIWIGLAIPNGWDLATFFSVAVPNYLIKLVLAVGMTPLVYLGHGIVERYLGREQADELAEAAHA